MASGFHSSMKREGLLQCLLLLLALTILGITGLLHEPKVSIPKYMELGRGEEATCEVPNPPDSESLSITMYLRGVKVSTTQSRTAESEIAQALISPDRPGEFWVECSVSDDKETKKANASFSVYNFPNPKLEISDDDEDEHNLVITCTLPDVNPETALIKIEVNRTVLTCQDSARPRQRICTLPSIKEHNGKTVVCEASMSGLEKIMTKKTETKLDITYPPEFEDSKCPLNRTVEEGASNLLLCPADGNPQPSVVCIKDGVEYREGRLPQVTRNHSGLYKCRAHNKLDNNVRDVTVLVQPRNLAYFIRASSGITMSMLALTVLVLLFK